MLKDVVFHNGIEWWNKQSNLWLSNCQSHVNVNHFSSIWRVRFVNYHYDSQKFSPQAIDTQYLQEKVDLCFSYFPSSWLFLPSINIGFNLKVESSLPGALLVICPMNISQQPTAFE